MSTLVLALAAVATNLATAMVPGWAWLHSPGVLWAAVGGLVAAAVVLAWLGATAADASRTETGLAPGRRGRDGMTAGGDIYYAEGNQTVVRPALGGAPRPSKRPPTRG